MRRIACLLSIIFAFISHLTWAAPAVSTASDERGRFMTVSDIHFNPLSSCKRKKERCHIVQQLQNAPYQDWDTILASQKEPVANAKQDTNYALFQSMINELQRINQQNQPQFVLVLGDFLAHQFQKKYKRYAQDKTTQGYELFTKKTLQFLTYKLNQAFPNTDVYPALGNNDTYTGNYDVVPRGQFLRDMAREWSQLIKDKQNRQRFLDTFPEAGYYTVTIPKDQKIIILNTVLFSPIKATQAKKIAANQQLTWLQNELTSAKKQHQRVYLAMHIPMGVDVFASLKRYLFSITEFWQPAYSEAFSSILKTFSGTIAAILPGHIHMDAYQFIVEDQIPVIFTPSISPVYGNNPGFKVFSYELTDLAIINYQTYFYPYNMTQPDRWKLEYSFNSVYQPDCPSCQLISGMNNVLTNQALAKQYQAYFDVSKHQHPIQQKNDWKPYYRCSINNIAKIDYTKCLRTE